MRRFRCAGAGTAQASRDIGHVGATVQVETPSSDDPADAGSPKVAASDDLSTHAVLLSPGDIACSTWARRRRASPLRDRPGIQPDASALLTRRAQASVVPRCWTSPAAAPCLMVIPASGHCRGDRCHQQIRAGVPCDPQRRNPIQSPPCTDLQLLSSLMIPARRGYPSDSGDVVIEQIMPSRATTMGSAT